MRATAIGLFILTATTLARAAGIDGFTCAARMEAARSALLHAGFDPAKDTATWLRVTGLLDGGLMLNVYTVYSPDGDGYRTYEATLRPASSASDRAWRLRARDALDEFKEERLPERTWTRARAGWVARLHTRTEDRARVHLFERVVRPALEDCLSHPGAVGKMERCAYDEDENRWTCTSW